MKINSIKGTVNFSANSSYSSVLAGRKSFYELSMDDKLDVLYDMLIDEKENFKTVSFNQQKVMNFNKRAFKYVLLNDAEPYLPDEAAVAKLEHAYDKNKIDIIV